MKLSRHAAACALAACALAACALAAVAPVSASQATTAVPYHFRTLNNGADLTFNELLGISNHGKIAGYYGSGARFHPNKGYLLLPPYGQSNYRAENFPHSVQTQVT